MIVVSFGASVTSRSEQGRRNIFPSGRGGLINLTGGEG